MVLTGCIVHGFGVFLYLVDEGMAQGASWTIEVETHLQPNLHTCSLPPSSQCVVLQAPRQCDLSTRPLRWHKKKNRRFPTEFLVGRYLLILYLIYFIYIYNHIILFTCFQSPVHSVQTEFFT